MLLPSDARPWDAKNWRIPNLSQCFLREKKSLAERKSLSLAPMAGVMENGCVHGRIPVKKRVPSSYAAVSSATKRRMTRRFPRVKRWARHWHKFAAAEL